ncbi:MAG: hypothetical protein RL693_1641 [Verrucomicrobiota bacterium]|jgi:hypothetical protein
MKSPLRFFSGTRFCWCVLVLTTLSEPTASCGLPFGRTLSVIKARVGQAFQKIGKDDDEMTLSSRYSRNRETPKVSDSRYGPPPPPGYQTPAQRQESTVPSVASRNSAEILYSAPAGEPGIILRNAQQISTSVVVPAVSEKMQPVDFNKPTALETSESKTMSEPAPQASLPQPPVTYARPVAGHPGFVYPPGVTEGLKNMLDVRGCTPGEKMRDPRTGTVFFVP